MRLKQLKIGIKCIIMIILLLLILFMGNFIKKYHVEVVNIIFKLLNHFAYYNYLLMINIPVYMSRYTILLNLKY